MAARTRALRIAIGLPVPRLRAPGAAGIAVIMVGALHYHVTAGHPLEGTPALVILLLCVYVFARTRGAASVA